MSTGFPASDRWTHGRQRILTRSGVIAATAALAAVLSACGSSSGSSGSGGGKTYVAAIPAIATSLDPSDFGGGTRPLFATLDSDLFNYASSSCSTSLSSDNLVGELAKSWTLSADRKSYDIVLNNYKSEYGNPLTSADIKWSLQRGIATSPIVKFLSANSAHYAADPITIVSPSEFKLNVTQATPVDLAMFTIPSFAILDSTEAMKYATTSDPWAKTWLATHSDSFGPWKVDSVQQGSQITLLKNPGFGGARGNISKVILKQIPSAADQAQLLQSGAVQYANALSWSQYKSLQGNSKVTVYPCAPLSRDVLIVNFKDPALGNVEVRQAISMAIDRTQLNTGAYSGLGTPALTGLLPSELPAGTSAPGYTYDVAAAKALLAKAGYPNGFAMTLSYNENQPGSQVDQSSILIQNQLAQIGIKVSLDHVANGNDFNKDQTTGNFQAILYYSGSALPAAYFDVGLEEPGSPNDSWGFADSKWTDLVNQLSAAPVGSSAYKDVLAQLNQYNVQQLPWIPLVDTPNIFAMSSSVTDVGAGMRTGAIIPQPAVMNIK